MNRIILGLAVVGIVLLLLYYLNESVPQANLCDMHYLEYDQLTRYDLLYIVQNCRR